MNLYKNPVEGIPIGEPKNLPLPDQIIIGYEIVNEDMYNKTVVTPQPQKMNCFGWVSVLLCFIVFWPLTCVPCCLKCSYDVYQVPVYGYVHDVNSIIYVDAEFVKS